MALKFLVGIYASEGVGVGFCEKLNTAGRDQILERLQHIGAEFPELLDDGAGDGQRHAEKPVVFLDALLEHLVRRQVAVVCYPVEDFTVQLVILVGRRERLLAVAREETVGLVHLKVEADVWH